MQNHIDGSAEMFHQYLSGSSDFPDLFVKLFEDNKGKNQGSS
jgi:hypothetical protein